MTHPNVTAVLKFNDIPSLTDSCHPTWLKTPSYFLGLVVQFFRINSAYFLVYHPRHTFSLAPHLHLTNGYHFLYLHHAKLSTIFAKTLLLQLGISSRLIITAHPLCHMYSGFLCSRIQFLLCWSIGCI